MGADKPGNGAALLVRDVAAGMFAVLRQAIRPHLQAQQATVHIRVGPDGGFGQGRQPQQLAHRAQQRRAYTHCHGQAGEQIAAVGCWLSLGAGVQPLQAQPGPVVPAHLAGGRRPARPNWQARRHQHQALAWPGGL